MREIPNILKPFVGRDVNGEYLNLQDSNGNMNEIRISENTFRISSTSIQRNISVSNAINPPEIHFDCRNRKFMPGSYLDMTYHLRRKPVPGETFVLIIGDTIYNFFQVIGDKSYISISIAAATGIGIPNTTGPNFDFVNRKLYWEIYADEFRDGNVISVIKDNSHWRSWATIAKSSLQQVEDLNTITGSGNQSPGYAVEIDIDFEGVVAEFPNGAPDDLNDHTFRVLIQDVLDPESKLYMNICLDPNDWPLLPG